MNVRTRALMEWAERHAIDLDRFYINVSSLYAGTRFKDVIRMSTEHYVWTPESFRHLKMVFGGELEVKKNTFQRTQTITLHGEFPLRQWMIQMTYNNAFVCKLPEKQELQFECVPAPFSKEGGDAMTFEEMTE